MASLPGQIPRHTTSFAQSLTSCSPTRSVVGASHSSISLLNHGQKRHATLLRRPRRPYSFTQLVTLSDGSTYTQRTTSPAPVYKSTKDSRNHAMWNPSLSSLRDVEKDEAGRLRAFRERFGRGWDSSMAADTDGDASAENAEDQSSPSASDGHDNLMDLISGYASGSEQPEAKTKTAEKKSGGKGKGKR